MVIGVSDPGLFCLDMIVDPSISGDNTQMNQTQLVKGVDNAGD
jgi:hypothetical protein